MKEMKTTLQWIGGIALVIGCLIVIGYSVSRDVAAENRIKWEYRIEVVQNNGRLDEARKGMNGLGDDGWELVSTHIGSTDDGNPRGYFYIYKRQK